MPPCMRWHVYLLVDDDIREAEVAVFWDAILATLKALFGSVCVFFWHILGITFCTF